MAENDEKYLNPDLPIEERAKDLVSRMTLEEKASQMIYTADAVKHLGIPAYNWWNECLHGVARAGRATVFPQAIGMAATFDSDLVGRVASAIGDEGRAKYNQSKRKGYTSQYQGLTFWTPNINIFRDPRWGRGHETYGEDPFLTALIGTAFVKGLQGDDPKYMKAAACAKHYAVHSGPEALRHTFDAVVDQKDLWETYLPAFRTLVEAGVEAVMGAYNRTLHEPCCGSKLLLVDILREKWGFDGHVVSDCWAVRDFHEHHKVTAGPIESAALAVQNGCDVNCGCTYEFVVDAVKKGLLSEEAVDRSVMRLMATRIKLGMFDPPEQVPFEKIGPEVIGCDEHRALALETAEKSLVLLKNKDEILPLNPTDDALDYVLVVGPNAVDTTVLMGNYYGMNERMSTILEGIVGAAGNTVKFDYRKAFFLDRPNANPRDWGSFESRNADAVIAVLGLAPELEGEEGDAIASPDLGDRSTIELPQAQIDFLRKVHKSGAPLIVILTGGSAIALGEVADWADAILWAWYPGQEGGTAVGNAIFGKTVPSGRLPITFPKSTDQLPPFEDYSMEGRTYRYMTADPLYPFGFGLSYTAFEYSGGKASKSEIGPAEEITVSAEIRNSGECAAEEVVQCYVKDLKGSCRTPLASLRGIRRVALKPGESTRVDFTLGPEDLGLVTESGAKVVESGEFEVEIGGCSPGRRGHALGAPAPARVPFTVK
jgi:beta-glucosidase